MTTLVIAEHDNQTLKPATLNTVAAATAIAGDVHVLVAGHNAGEVAKAASQIAGVGKVIHGVIVLFVQIGALWLETQHPCGFAADGSVSAGRTH